MKGSAGYKTRFLALSRRLLRGRFAQERLPLSTIFEHFRRVLDRHNRAIEIMTDMGEKLGGDYLFDITYLRRSYSELRGKIEETIRSFDLLTRGKYRELNGIFGGIDEDVNRLLFPMQPSQGVPVLFLDEITADRGSEVGGKNANLAVLKNELKLPVPDGFSITTGAFDEFVRYNGIDEKISLLGGGEEIAAGALQDIRNSVLRGEFPPTLSSEIDKALGRLRMRCSGDCRLAVRSSAVEEDREYSFAGQYETVLNVPLEGGEVKEAYKQVLASLYTEKSVAYHRQAGLDIRNGRMAACCLCMVDARTSGVIYSVHPGGEGDTLLISSTWGLGTALVEGETDADHYLVRRGPQPAIAEKRIGGKVSRVVYQEGGGVQTIISPPEIAGQSSLADEEIFELARLGMLIEKHFRSPQDIEWAIDREGRFFLLQARPLRPAEQTATSGNRAELLRHLPVLFRAKGIVVQAGAGAGEVFLFRHMDDLDRFPRGAVLVAHHDSSNFVRVMPFVSAIITDVGSPTSHMAAVCREFRVPAIVNTGDATRLLKHGQAVTLLADDEGNMTVYEGAAAGQLLAQAGSGAMSMDELYEFRKKKYVLRYISPLNLIDPLLENFLPAGCKTMHDILRFIHEKSVAELIEGARSGSRTKEALKLELPIPAGIVVADIGGGLREARDGGTVTFEDVASVPFRAILKGMMHPGAWHAETVSLQAQDFFSSMMRMPDIVSDNESFLTYNVAVISRDYVNLSLRFGYHYNMMDCYCSDNARDNHIYFRFTGGATDILKRSRRLELIARILRDYGFTIKIKGDVIVARLSNIGRAEMEAILDQTGRLIAYTRQLDAVLYDDDKIERYVNNFMEGKYEL